MVDVMLWLFMWGEAGNLRHMPECLCFLYHKMMQASVGTAGVKARGGGPALLRLWARPLVRSACLSSRDPPTRRSMAQGRRRGESSRGLTRLGHAVVGRWYPYLVRGCVQPYFFVFT